MKYTLREKIGTKKLLLIEGDKFQYQNMGDSLEAEVCILSCNTKLTEAVLKKIEKGLTVSGDLYIYREGKHIDYQREGILLLQCGFDKIVEMRERFRNGYVIHCKKRSADYEQGMLSIIVPVYNEENTVGELLTKLVQKQFTGIKREIIVVESNSRDKTREIVKTFEKYPDVSIVWEDKPSGKGNAVLSGIRFARGEFIAIQDGDLEYDIEDYDKLLPDLAAHKTFFVLGSRYRKNDWKMRKFENSRRWVEDYLNLGQIILTKLVNFTCGCRLSDPFTMYKIFHRDCMYGVRFQGNDFGLDWEIIIRYIRKGYKPIEIPITYNARSYSEGKHISLIKTPLEGLSNLIRCRYISNVYDYGDE